MLAGKLKQIGVVLMAAGATAVLISTGLMIASFADAQTGQPSPSALAEGLSRSLLPSTIGMPLLIAGLVTFLVGWFRGRRERRTARS